ncbi:MAG: ABC-2 type transport system ATP-binding protein [Myxococcota bacterium]
MTDAVIQIEKLAKRFSLVELERLLEFKPGDVFRRIAAVTDVSLTVGPGQVYGFLGPNGAGKTTTMKMCMDLIRPSSGQIRLFGQSPQAPSVKSRIGYLPEHPYFYDYLKPREILDYYARLFGLSRSERKTRISALIERVGLGHAVDRSLRKFSKGMLQRLGVAQALINDPDLLVFDEPLSGLDPMGRKAIRDIMIDERAKGKTIFFSSHILSDIEHVCDRVAIITHGVLRREGMLSELLAGEQRQSEVLIRNGDTALDAALEPIVATSVALGAGVTRVVVDTERCGEVLQAALSAGAVIEQVQAHRDSLEDLFVRTAGETP